MKLAGLLLLLAGWFLVLAAITMLRTFPQRFSFVLAGVGVEVLGLIFLIRSHLTARQGIR